jgi:hypothetical protein
MAGKRQLSIWLPEELFQALERFARERGSSKTQVVLRAIAAVVTEPEAADRLMKSEPRLHLLDRPRK